MRQLAIRKIVLLWLAWLIILFTYQTLVTARYRVQKPDDVLFWTAPRASESDLSAQPYLTEPWMNAQVAWDSEFYLSIALQGYNDPQVRTVLPPETAQPPFNRPLSLNYAFFPVYPHLMRLVALPFKAVGLSPIASLTLAGVIISALGTLLGMIALAQLTESSDPQAGLRTAFYLISFPTGCFLAQVYTEGLFVGLSFGCLALVQRKHWIAAALLASVAALTKAIGVALLIPILLAWLKQIRQSHTWRDFPQKTILQGAALGLPLLVHLIWKFSFFGTAFQIVEHYYFNCRLFNFSGASQAWRDAFSSIFTGNSATAAYYIIELTTILIGITSCFLTLKRYPGISLYSLLTIFVSLTCGTTWSISRYLLTVPSLFLSLGHLGRFQLFDRIWSLISILFLALLTTLFSFNLWAG